MKIVLSFSCLFLICCSIWCKSNHKIIYLQQSGTLHQYIADNDKYKIKSLRLSGNINGDDIKLIREMAGGNYNDYSCNRNGQLENLDLTDCHLVSGGHPYLASNYTNSLNELYSKKDTLNQYSFISCYKLKTIRLPKTIKCLEDFAFAYCLHLKSISLGDSLLYIGTSAFQNCKSLTKIDLPNSLKRIDHFAFCWCDNLKKIVIPNSVNHLSGLAFNKCRKLSNVILSQQIDTIYASTFFDCVSLKHIILPDSLKWIDVSAFGDCVSLQQLSLPSKLNYIGAYAFTGCSNLNKLYFKNKQNISLDFAAFNGCAYLEKIYFTSLNPPTIVNIPQSAFYFFDDYRIIYVPKGAEETYRESIYGYYEIKERPHGRN